MASNTARLAAMRQELEELSAPEAQTQRPELAHELQDLNRQKTDAVNVVCHQDNIFYVLNPPAGKVA